MFFAQFEITFSSINQRSKSCLHARDALVSGAEFWWPWRRRRGGRSGRQLRRRLLGRGGRRYCTGFCARVAIVRVLLI